MAFVRVEQSNARLAAAVKVDFVKGRDGDVAKGTVTVISNTRRGAGDHQAEEATAIQWTLWGKQAENAAKYLGKRSRVNVIGRVQNNNYDKDGATVYGFQFTCEELDYLDSKSDSEARTRGHREWIEAYDREQGAGIDPASKRGRADRKPSVHGRGASAN